MSLKTTSRVFLVFLVLEMPLAMGQEVKKDSVTQLEEVILSERRKSRPLIGITATATVGTSIFENYGPLDVASSINQISGVHMLSGALNTNRITIRGVGARTPYGTDKLRLYYNEIPITNGSGFSTIEAYDLENLSSIEIIKGPKGSAYGSNLGGAILLKTEKKSEKGTQLNNSLTLGSYNLFKNNLSLSHTQERISLDLRYGHLETDGYRENSNFKRDALLLNGSYAINDRNHIEVLVNHIDYTAQIPSSIGKSAFEEDPSQAAFTWKEAKGYEANEYTLAGISYSHLFNENFKNTTSIFYSYLDHYEPRPFNILDEFTNGYGLRTRFMGRLNFLGTPLDYFLGTELYKDEYHWGTFENLYAENNGMGSLKGDRISNNREFRAQWNSFANLTLPIGSRFTAQLGLNLNKTKYRFVDLYNPPESNTSAGRDFDPILLPSLDLVYTLTGDKSLYANISRGYSNPSLEETLTPTGTINPDIDQEKGINYEVGTRMQLADRKLSLKIAVYRMDIKNLLVAQRVGDDQFIGTNAGKTRHQGLEVEVEHRFKIGAHLAVDPFIAYTLNDHSFVSFVDGDRDHSGNPLTGVPKNRITSGLQIRHSSGLYWNTTHQYVDEIPMDDANSVSNKAYTLFNTKVGYKKEVFRNLNVGLVFGINNIGNVTYAPSILINAVGFGASEPRYYYPGNPRNYYTGLHLKYGL